ncbi:MAG TPA: hypothetical protein VGG61_15775 [Gemmataceae bacterium]|jgi:hypothetical protein
MRPLLILTGTFVAFSLAVAAPAPDAKYTYVDLKGKFNHKITEKFHATDTDENNLAIEPGKQKLGDIDFQIGDGVIQLGSIMVKEDPEKVEGIKIGSKFIKLHIIHACGYGGGPNTKPPGFVEDGTTIGEYKVYYDDKTTETIPIVYGEDVRDWWFGKDEKEPSKSQVVWKSETEQSKKYMCGTRLYLSTWKNPKPGKKVVSIDYIGRKTETGAAPFCVAMTLEGE